MAKTQEELNQLKTEYKTLNNKLKELTEDELKQVIGGGYGGENTYDENGEIISFSGYYQSDIVIFISYITGRIFLKHIGTNKMREVVDNNWPEVVEEIRKP